MAGLSLIVFPVLGVVGIVKHLSMPSYKRSEKSKAYFSRYVLGVILTWFSFELKGSIDPILLAIFACFGIYLWLFNGIWLFGEEEVIFDFEDKLNSNSFAQSLLDKKSSSFKAYDNSIGLNQAVKESCKEHSTESTQAVIDTEKEVYPNVTRENKGISSEKLDISEQITLIISGEGWKFDKVNKILWNPSTNEMLSSSSGLGFSLSSDYFLIYNKKDPRKIPKIEVVEAEFKK